MATKNEVRSNKSNRACAEMTQKDAEDSPGGNGDDPKGLRLNLFGANGLLADQMHTKSFNPFDLKRFRSRVPERVL